MTWRGVFVKSNWSRWCCVNTAQRNLWFRMTCPSNGIKSPNNNYGSSQEPFLLSQALIYQYHWDPEFQFVTGDQYQSWHHGRGCDPSYTQKWYHWTEGWDTVTVEATHQLPSLRIHPQTGSGALDPRLPRELHPYPLEASLPPWVCSEPVYSSHPLSISTEHDLH